MNELDKKVYVLRYTVETVVVAHSEEEARDPYYLLEDISDCRISKEDLEVEEIEYLPCGYDKNSLPYGGEGGIPLRDYPYFQKWQQACTESYEKLMSGQYEGLFNKAVTLFVRPQQEDEEVK
jgi:hypothetical protein